MLPQQIELLFVPFFPLYFFILLFYSRICIMYMFEFVCFINTCICRGEGENNYLLIILKGSFRWSIIRVCFPCEDCITAVFLKHIF